MGSLCPIGSFRMSLRVIGPVIGGIADVNILFFVLFRSGFHVVGRHWMLSHVFRLLSRFSVYDFFNDSSHPIFDVGYNLGTDEIDRIRRFSHMFCH